MSAQAITAVPESPVSVEDYYRWAIRRYRLKTVERDLKILKRLKEEGVLDLEQEAVVDYLLSRPVSTGTRIIELQAYRRWLRFLGEKPGPKLLEASMDLERLRPRKLARIPPLETFQGVIASLKPGHFPRQVLVLILETGLRVGEVLALRWKQVDLEKGVLILEESEKRSEGSVVPLSEAAKAVLQERRAQVPEARPEDLVFPVRYRCLQRCLSLAKKRCSHLPGVDLVNFKNARHVFATRLYARTKDLVYVQRMLRHRSILTTQRYVHMVTSRKSYEVKAVPPHDRQTLQTLLAEGFEVALQTKDLVYLRRLKEAF